MGAGESDRSPAVEIAADLSLIEAQGAGIQMPSERVTQMRVEFRCYHCAQGTELVVKMDPHYRATLRLHCARCGGQMFLDDFESLAPPIVLDGVGSLRPGRRPKSKVP